MQPDLIRSPGDRAAGRGYESVMGEIQGDQAAINSTFLAQLLVHFNCDRP